MDNFISWLSSIFKLSGSKTFAIAAGCGLIIWIDNNQINFLSPDTRELIFIFGIITSCISVSIMLCNCISLLKPPIQKIIWEFNAQRAAKKNIDFLSPKDKEIIAYLLHHNQKIFMADSDGEEAIGLITIGFAVRALRHGQFFIEGNVPFSIPDYIWKILVKNIKLFPYVDNKDAAYPWRTGWMAKRI